MRRRRWSLAERLARPLALPTALQDDAAGGGGAPASLVYDTATDVNDTSLDAHAPDIDTVGSGWVERRGAWIITSNEIATSGVDPGGVKWLATIDAGQANTSFTATIHTGASFNTALPGLVVRYNPTDGSFWLVNFNATTVFIFEYTGSFTQRASGSIAHVADADYTLVVECNGNTITVTDQEQTVSYASAATNNDKTHYGIRDAGGGSTYDELTVVPL